MTTMAGALMVIDTETSAEVDAVEQLAHVVERVDGDAEPADLAERARVVAVEAHQRRQVERGAQAGLALVEQELEALVGLPGGAEAGELPHRPQPAAVHGGVDAARERVLAGIARGPSAPSKSPSCSGVYSGSIGTPLTVVGGCSSDGSPDGS